MWLVCCFDWQVLELCVGFCAVHDLRAAVCRLITESPSDCTSLLTRTAHWAALSPTELTVAVECLQHIYEVSISVFTALHVMQTRYSDENSVRPSACHTREL